jgi:chromosomal replication initiation ATPase DnaA
VDSPLPEPRPLMPVFIIEEVGLTNRQVWAATLAELASRGSVSRADLETWLRPASLIGRDGATLIVGAPNAVARDRVATRLLPVLRQALAATIGVALEVVVETEDEAASRQVGKSAS